MEILSDALTQLKGVLPGVSILLSLVAIGMAIGVRLTLSRASARLGQVERKVEYVKDRLHILDDRHRAVRSPVTPAATAGVIPVTTLGSGRENPRHGGGNEDLFPRTAQAPGAPEESVQPSEPVIESVSLHTEPKQESPSPPQHPRLRVELKDGWLVASQSLSAVGLLEEHDVNSPSLLYVNEEVDLNNALFETWAKYFDFGGGQPFMRYRTIRPAEVQWAVVGGRGRLLKRGVLEAISWSS